MDCIHNEMRVTCSNSLNTTVHLSVKAMQCNWPDCDISLQNWIATIYGAVSYIDGHNGGSRVIFHGSSSRGRLQKKEIEVRCEFCLECEGEPGQVCLAVEAFTFTGCRFYFPTGF